MLFRGVSYRMCFFGGGVEVRIGLDILRCPEVGIEFDSLRRLEVRVGLQSLRLLESRCGQEFEEDFVVISRRWFD